MLVRQKESGDTLVEVLLAFALLSIVTVTCYAVMNMGVGRAQMALERSQTRMAINSQIEVMTYFRDQYMKALADNTDPMLSQASSQWSVIRTTYAQPNAGKSPTSIGDCSAALSNSFYVAYSGGNYSVQGSPSTTAPTLPSPGTGMWVEAIPSSGLSSGAVPYVDLYVKACWDPLVGSTKQSLSSVVRLYDR